MDNGPAPSPFPAKPDDTYPAVDRSTVKTEGYKGRPSALNLCFSEVSIALRSSFR
jgi:hypothetical protein